MTPHLEAIQIDPPETSLLEAFRRFCDLSCYWHRAHTPDSLAIQELQERARLERDLPEMIKRAVAFADLAGTEMFSRYASIKAAAPAETAKSGPATAVGHIRADYESKAPETAVLCDCGASEEVWRMLEEGEVIQIGDEVLGVTKWLPVNVMSAGIPVQPGFVGDFRRRVTPPSDNQGAKLP